MYVYLWYKPVCVHGYLHMPVCVYSDIGVSVRNQGSVCTCECVCARMWAGAHV